MLPSVPVTVQIIPLIAHVMEGQPTPSVLARTLYAFLQLNPAAYARWTQKNIVKNPYAMEHVDWEYFQPDVENPVESRASGRPSLDFVLTMDFAKRLSMMARSPKGEEARQYFLACEKTAHEQARMPVLHNPMSQVMIDMVLRVDTLEYENAERKKENARLTADLARTESKADLLFEDGHRMTLEEFILKNGLVRQFPKSKYAEYAAWLKTFCAGYGLSIQKAPVYGKSWDEENAYLLSALSAWLRHETQKPRQVHLVPRAEQER